MVVHDDVVRTAELVASLSLATDLAMGLPREHGLESTVIGARLARSLGVDDDTASQVYYGSLLYYIGCTADAEISAELFPWGTMLENFNPAIYGSPGEVIRGILRSIPTRRRTASRGRSRSPARCRGRCTDIPYT